MDDPAPRTTRHSQTGTGGIVYILSNPGMPGLLKIGRTGRPLAIRLREINSATGVPFPYKVEAIIEARNAKAVEAATHAALCGKRVNRRREFFRSDLASALRAAKRAAGRDGGRMKTGRRARPHAPLPSAFSAIAVALAGFPTVGLAHPSLPLLWLAACAVAALSGRPRPLAELLDVAGGRGVAVHLLIVAAGLASGGILGFPLPIR